MELMSRLSSLGYEAGLRILSLILLRNTQQAGGKVRSLLPLTADARVHCCSQPNITRIPKENID